MSGSPARALLSASVVCMAALIRFVRSARGDDASSPAQSKPEDLKQLSLASPTPLGATIFRFARNSCGCIFLSPRIDLWEKEKIACVQLDAYSWPSLSPSF